MMRKDWFSLGLLLIAFSLQAETPPCGIVVDRAEGPKEPLNNSHLQGP